MYLDNVDELKFNYDVTYEDYIQTHLSDGDLNIIPGLYLSKIGYCFIIVNKYGGMTPHFEIYSIDGGRTFKSCLKIYKPEYYFRENEEFQKLSSSNLIELNNFLNKGFMGQDEHYTNFDSIESSWDYLNNGKAYEINQCKTDYRLLKDY